MQSRQSHITIDGRRIGAGYPTYIIAEISANHHQNFDEAVKLIHAAKDAGADAVKLQTYTPDTMTIDCDGPPFRIKGTIWHGQNLYSLYRQAYTPWEWQPKLKKIADRLNISLFSTPFDETAVDFLEKMNVPAHKVASFENSDLPLLQKLARTGKPVIMSTGMATLAEIDESVRTLREAGNRQLALLKCTSAYPAEPDDANLRTIPNMSDVFGVPVGLSDHTLGSAVAIAATSLGSCILEKHFILSRSVPGPDSAFSMEPREFKEMVSAVRIAEKALGNVRYGPGKGEVASRAFRRSIFAVKDIRKGEKLSKQNVRRIRPGHGLAPRHFDEIIGRTATRDIRRGTPLTWELVGGGKG